ncbi:TLD_family protein [Hexamita inflata]|uniref:Oxidation resistance protein 1 n=1 Tax=Hexamita inflata TaxID=28002 RepID=A0ABP1I762_9EUKA
MKSQFIKDITIHLLAIQQQKITKTVFLVIKDNFVLFCAVQHLIFLQKYFRAFWKHHSKLYFKQRIFILIKLVSKTKISQQNLTPLSQCGAHLPDILVPTDDPLGFDIAIVLRINFKQSFTLTDHFLGRKSQILSDEYLNQLYNILPKMLSQFKMLVQYTSAFDGRHLQNLYNSYGFQRTDITNKEMYNNHLELSQLKLSQTQIIIIRANDQVFGVIFTGQLASIQGGLNYGSSIFNLQSGHKWSAVNEYILKRCDRLVVGVSGSAIVLQSDLMAVQTSFSESYNSPELFQGDRYGMFVQAHIQCVELIRFVIE